MRKTFCCALALLFTLASFISCTGNPSSGQDLLGAAQSPEPTAVPVSAPVETPSVTESAPDEPADTEPPSEEPDHVGFDTPEPEEQETPILTEVPTQKPTATPEPNPFVGVWTIEDLPFSLELRTDNTYLITASEMEREGQYTFSSNRVSLRIDDESTVEMQYYENADVFKLDDFKLIRDDLVFFYEINGVPVSYEAENGDLYVTVRGGVVDVKTKNGKLMQDYCFTKAGLKPGENSRDWFDVSDTGEPSDSLHTFKYDGQYTLCTRDAEGNHYDSIDVVVVSGFRYPVRAEGLDYVRQSVKSILKEKGTSVDEMNRAISRDIAAAGLYTRAGVVTSGVSLISHMAKLGLSIVYQGHGAYQAARNWGINPNWGAKLETPTSDPNGTYYYTGMQCVASIVWAYKQAGMNLSSEVNSEIGTLGERTRARDNRIDFDRAESGDIVKSGGHYLMIVDRLDQNGDGADDAYLTYEMWAPHLTFLILTFKQIHGREFFSMDAFFDNTGRNKKKAAYWKNTFCIPYENLPQYLKEAVESEKLEQDYSKLLSKLGF
jgi:hypothetical protein